MISWGKSKGYEVSSVGDWRFSALYAVLFDGRTIEQHYQCCVKGHDPLGTNWKLGKGKPPLRNITQEQLYNEYRNLWQQWADSNPDLIDELFNACQSLDCCLRDSFANTPINQARALSDILNSIYFKELK